NLLPAGTTSVECGQTTFSAPDNPGNFYVSTKEILNLSNIAANDFYTVQEVLVPPTSGASQLCGYDQAIYILTSNVPASEAVPLIPRVDVPVTPGEAYTAIGFGITSDSASDNGTRRKLTGLKVECGGTECSATYGSQINTQHEWGGDRGTCEGDSGGPALDAQ